VTMPAALSITTPTTALSVGAGMLVRLGERLTFRANGVTVGTGVCVTVGVCVAVDCAAAITARQVIPNRTEKN